MEEQCSSTVRSLNSWYNLTWNHTHTNKHYLWTKLLYWFCMTLYYNHHDLYPTCVLMFTESFPGCTTATHFCCTSTILWRSHVKVPYSNVNLLVSQLTPVNPAAHTQVYPLMPSMQRPPKRHGLEAHSSMSEKGRQNKASLCCCSRQIRFSKSQ